MIWAPANATPHARISRRMLDLFGARIPAEHSGDDPAGALSAREREAG
jgi:hypothetical protein